MNTFRHVDIANKYKVSKATVTRWVDLALSGKNNLQVIHIENKIKVLDNPHNRAQLQMLAEEGKKYRTKSGIKRTKTNSHLYQLFTQEEIVEIINSLVKYNYLPLKYTINKNDRPEFLNSIITDQIKNLYKDIVYLNDQFEKINFVDHSLQASKAQEYLVKQADKDGLLSESIQLDLMEENTTYRPFNRDLASSIIATNLWSKSRSKHGQACNVHTLLDNSICHARHPLPILDSISQTMLKGDLLIVSFLVDTNWNRSDFSYLQLYSIQDDLQILQLFGLDTSNCEVFNEYNDDLHCRERICVLDKDYQVSFEIGEQEFQFELLGADKISLRRQHLFGIEEFMAYTKEIGLEVIQVKTDKTLSQAIAICQIKSSV